MWHLCLFQEPARTNWLAFRPGGFVDDPHGMGAYGLGWIRKNTSGQITAINLVTRAYEKHVRWRLLWSLRDEAWDWFSERLPQAKARDGQVSRNDVHRDVAAAEIMARHTEVGNALHLSAALLFSRG